MEDAFADQYPVCSNSGIGYVYSGRYKHKKFNANHVLLDSSACIDANGIQLYLIFSGFNGGGRAAKFAMNRMVYEIFQDKPISMLTPRNQVAGLLEAKFKIVATRYFEMFNEDLNERFLLKDRDNEANKAIISEIDQKIREGSTAIVALKMDHDLFVVHCGCSMALVITDERGREVFRINEHEHDNEDSEEVERLTAIGVEPKDVLNPTRAIGDLHRSHFYEEKPEFAKALSAPVVAQPDVYHIIIDESWKYIVLISDGVVQNLKESQVEDIPTEVYVRLKEDHTETSTAQGLVDAFARKHMDAYIRNVEENSFSVSNQREEMTVIFVKLPHEDSISDFYETVDTVFSTVSSISNDNDSKPIEPYVDTAHKSEHVSENVTKMERYIIQAHTM